jgi:hypothetical protein
MDKKRFVNLLVIEGFRGKLAADIWEKLPTWYRMGYLPCRPEEMEVANVVDAAKRMKQAGYGK